jgi:hypothetical protein
MLATGPLLIAATALPGLLVADSSVLLEHLVYQFDDNI